MAGENVYTVAGMVDDTRVRIFRRHFSMPGVIDALQVDAYIIITARYIVVCDTLLCPEDVAAMLEEVRGELIGRQLLVINSHADWDHAWGNSYFTQGRAAPIIAHADGWARMQSDEAQVELSNYQCLSATFRNVVLTAPTITCTHPLTIYGGDLTLQVFPAPGHHSDHLALWIPELRLLIAFDAVEHPLPLLENAQGVRPMQETLASFLTLQPCCVLCSHGETTSPAVVAENLAYIHELERRCRLFLATRRPGNAELEHAARLIEYPLDSAVAHPESIIDRSFYGWVHDYNARCMLQCLLA